MIVVSEDFQIKIMFNCPTLHASMIGHIPLFLLSNSQEKKNLQKTMIPKVLNLANILLTTR